MFGGVSNKSSSSGLYRRAKHCAAIDNHFKAPQKVECMRIISTKHVKVDQQRAPSRKNKDASNRHISPCISAGLSFSSHGAPPGPLNRTWKIKTDFF